MSTQYKLVRCNINGKDVEQMVDVRASLTDLLRNDFHLTSGFIDGTGVIAQSEGGQHANFLHGDVPAGLVLAGLGSDQDVGFIGIIVHLHIVPVVIFVGNSITGHAVDNSASARSDGGIVLGGHTEVGANRRIIPLESVLRHSQNDFVGTVVDVHSIRAGAFANFSSAQACTGGNSHAVDNHLQVVANLVAVLVHQLHGQGPRGMTSAVGSGGGVGEEVKWLISSISGDFPLVGGLSLQHIQLALAAAVVQRAISAKVQCDTAGLVVRVHFERTVIVSDCVAVNSEVVQSRLLLSRSSAERNHCDDQHERQKHRK